MRRPPQLQASDRAWLVLWAWVFGYNFWAGFRRSQGKQTEQLSEACDRYLLARRWPTEIWLALFYLHLSNHVPDRYDPIHAVFQGFDALCRQLRRLAGESV